MKPRTAALAALAAALATPASAQPDMRVTVAPADVAPPPGGTQVWQVSAEYLTVPPSPILQLWADVDIELSSAGQPITVVSWNTAYDGSGAPSLPGNGTDTVGVALSANAFFGSVDSSNPLSVLEFTYNGTPEDLTLTFVGQNAALFDLPPFGDLGLYTDLSGNQGELSYEIVIIPAPATLAPLTPAAALVARRRR